MKLQIRKTAVVMAAVAAVMSMNITSFAAETEGSYSYMAGQQENAARHGQFEQVRTFATDEERQAFFEEHGIGGDGQYSKAQHLDAEKLLEAGVIDQETADKIQAAASSKHNKIHEGYGNRDDMTAEERQAFYEGRKSDGYDGDSVSQLLNEGIITQEQADAINQYLSE